VNHTLWSGYKTFTSSQVFIFSKILQLPVDYFKLKRRQYRIEEKEIGRRYRGWEPMPGESFTDFKRRLKATKLLSGVCVASVFFFQLIGIVI